MPGAVRSAEKKSSCAACPVAPGDGTGVKPLFVTSKGNSYMMRLDTLGNIRRNDPFNWYDQYEDLKDIAQ